MSILRKTFYVIYILLIFLIAIIFPKTLNNNTFTTFTNEQSNNFKNLSAVREISKTEGVKEVAILSQNGRILVGVRTENADGGMIENTVQKVIDKSFLKCKTCVIAIENDLAIDIIELSYYLNTKTNPKILQKRFDFLVSKSKMTV